MLAAWSGSVRPSFVALPATLRSFGIRGWLIAAAAALGSAVLIGIPSVLIRNSFYIRMTPPRTQDYVFWVLSVLLLGLIAGTYAVEVPTEFDVPGTAVGGGLSYLAVGCPVCNKLVILFLGTSGALTFFAPAQLFLGIGSVLLLGWTLLLRGRVVTGYSCAIAPATPAVGGE